MGTITRTFANNITTSGVFKPTAFNNASFDNVTAVPGGAVEGGNMVLLSTQTASASASISFTTGIDSTYKEYMFIFNNIHPQTDTTDFVFNCSTDGGSSYNVTKTTTFFDAYHNESGSSAVLGYNTAYDLAQSTAFQILSYAISADADGSTSGYMIYLILADTTFVKHFIAVTNETQYNDYTVNGYIAGYMNTTSAIDAVQFKMASGNIDDGTIQMFGIL
jgi:hypothetical protein